jgi:hypothetical protein
MTDKEIINFIKRHSDLRNDYKVEHNTITVPLVSNYFLDRKFLESIVNGIDNYFAITGRHLVIYREMEEFITEATETDNNIGYVPENIETLMADAAFAVLQSVTATNQYLKDKNMLTEYYCA